jgi:hypothetical protein
MMINIGTSHIVLFLVICTWPLDETFMTTARLLEIDKVQSVFGFVIKNMSHDTTLYE